MSDAAETILRNLLDEILAELDYKNPEITIKAITSHGANYTSALFLPTVSSSGKPDLNLFAKVAIIGDQMREIMNGDTLFSTEQFFFTKLAKIYKSIEDKYNVSERSVFPKFYGGNPNFREETVILDNLVAQGYNTFNRFESVDWEYASKAVQVLARLHALSFAYQKENPKEFAETIKILEHKAVQENEGVKQAWTNMMNSAFAVLGEGPRVRVEEFFKKKMVPDLFKKMNMPLSTPVLIHGDYRTSNLMYKKDLKENTIDIIPVDFQTLHSGSPVNDLLYFVTMGTDEEFRRLHLDQLVEEYYSQLTLAMKRLDVDHNEVYPREVFDSEYKEMLPYVLLIAVGILPIVTVEAASAPKVEGDSNISEFLVKPNELFASRFSGIINDCIKWGVI